MKLEDFKKMKEFDDFKKLETLNLKNHSKFKEFYDKTTGGENHWNYSANLVVSDLVTQNKFKYAIVEMEDGDKVFLELKLIQIMKVRQLRLINVPISLNDNKENIKLIIKHLEKLPYVKATVKHKDIEMFEGWKVDKKLSEDDYYSDLEEWFKLYDNSRWRSKRRIKWFEENENFAFRLAEKDDVNNIHKFYEEWVDYKENIEKEDVSSKRMYVNLIKSIGKREDIKIYVSTYKERIIGVVGYSIYNNTANQIMNICHTRTVEQVDVDNKNDEKILKQTTTQTTYFGYRNLKEDGIEYVYCGDGTYKKGIAEYKAQANTGKIDYSIIMYGGKI